MAVNICVKNMEILSLDYDPLPSGLLLQGGRGFSQLSPENAFSKGVWLVRKEKKMRENERKREIFEQASPKSNLLLKSKYSPSSPISGI